MGGWDVFRRPRISHGAGKSPRVDRNRKQNSRAQEPHPYIDENEEHVRLGRRGSRNGREKEAPAKEAKHIPLDIDNWSVERKGAVCY